MQDDRPISVLILYTHALLGEGLVGLLSSEPGLDVVAVQSDDAETLERALTTTPQVIIFERGDPDHAVQILELVPGALVIDVGIGAGPTFTYRREEIPAWPDAIVKAIRQTKSNRDRGQTPTPATQTPTPATQTPATQTATTQTTAPGPAAQPRVIVRS